MGLERSIRERLEVVVVRMAVVQMVAVRMVVVIVVARESGHSRLPALRLELPVPGRLAARRPAVHPG
jgi:hypothetical protein